MTTGLYSDPRWPRANRWLAGDHIEEPTWSLGVIGLPACLGSITEGRCDLAPKAIRRALEKFSTYNAVDRVDVRQVSAHDWGDLAIRTHLPEESFDLIKETMTRSMREAGAMLLLGGDNSITRACVHGMGVPLKRCGLLTLDAHFDLRDLEGGFTNGNPVRALLADGLPGENIVQIGIQSFANSAEYAEVARDAGIRVVTAEEAHHSGLARTVSDRLAELRARVKTIYVDVDLDILDRAFSPATPGSRPGGFAVWELREAVRAAGACEQVKVMDLVELDPERDVADATTLTAAVCVLEFASGLVARR